VSQAYQHQALPPGTEIQEYRLSRVLAQGSFGIVYVAENTFLPETVAIKEFLPGELATRVEGTRVMPLAADLETTYQEALRKFLLEARTLYMLGEPEPHRNIVRVKRYHEANGTAYMVMDYEEGVLLAARLEAAGTLPEEGLMAILLPLMDGLEKVHKASVIHRDIKPDNILVRPDGSPVLIDFGAARRQTPDGAKSKIIVLTPDYAAPEQFNDVENQGPWTDIYALGATLYRAVTGTVPTSASSRLRGDHHDNATLVAGQGYSPEFLAAIDAALELEPADRPQSIADWRLMFRSEASVRISRGTKVVTKQQRHTSPLIWVSTLALFAIVSVGLTIWFTKEDSTPRPPTPSPFDHERATKTANELLVQFECAQVTPDISPDGDIHFSGFVSNRQDIVTLLDGVASIPGVRSVTNTLEVHPVPFCEFVGLLNTLQDLERPQSESVSLGSNQPDWEFKEGERFILHVTASNVFSGYLYVDFFDSQGNVTHLLPSPLSPSNQVLAGEAVDLGADPCPRCYLVEPPHGQYLLVALSTTDPLFTDSRAVFESSKEYLLALQGALERLRAHDGDFVSTFKYLLTHE